MDEIAHLALVLEVEDSAFARGIRQAERQVSNFGARAVYWANNSQESFQKSVAAYTAGHARLGSLLWDQQKAFRALSVLQDKLAASPILAARPDMFAKGRDLENAVIKSGILVKQEEAKLAAARLKDAKKNSDDLIKEEVKVASTRLREAKNAANAFNREEVKEASARLRLAKENARQLMQEDTRNRVAIGAANRRDQLMARSAGGLFGYQGARGAGFFTALNLPVPQILAGTVAVLAFGKAMSAVGDIVGAVQDKFAEFITTGFEQNAMIQKQEAAFKTWLFTAERAHAAIADLIDLANKTPFDNPTVLQMGRDLLAARVPVSLLRDSIEAIGNIAASRGQMTAESLGRVGYALQQVGAAGHLLGEEARQLKNAGVPALEAVAVAYGITTDKARRLMEQGQITTEVLLFSLRKFAQDTAPNAIKDQMEKMAGAWEGFTSNLRTGAALATEPWYRSLEKIVVAMNKFAQSRTFLAFFEAIAAASEQATDSLDRRFAPSLEALSKGDNGSLEGLRQAAKLAAGAVLGFVFFVDLGARALEKLNTSASRMVGVFLKLKEGDFAGALKSGLTGLPEVLNPGIAGITSIGDAMGDVTSSMQAFDKALNALFSGGKAREKDTRPPLGGLSPEAYQEAIETWLKFGEELNDIIDKNNEKVLEIEEDFNKKRLDVLKAFGEKVKDLNTRELEARGKDQEEAAKARMDLDKEIADSYATLTEKLADIERSWVENNKVHLRNVADAWQDYFRTIEDLDRTFAEAKRKRDFNEYLSAIKLQQDIRNAHEDFARSQADREQQRLDAVNKVNKEIEDAARAHRQRLEEIEFQMRQGPRGPVTIDFLRRRRELVDQRETELRDMARDIRDRREQAQEQLQVTLDRIRQEDNAEREALDRRLREINEREALRRLEVEHESALSEEQYALGRQRAERDLGDKLGNLEIVRAKQIEDHNRSVAEAGEEARVRVDAAWTTARGRIAAINEEAKNRYNAYLTSVIESENEKNTQIADALTTRDERMKAQAEEHAKLMGQFNDRKLKFLQDHIEMLEALKNENLTLAEAAKLWKSIADSTTTTVEKIQRLVEGGLTGFGLGPSLRGAASGLEEGFDPNSGLSLKQVLAEFNKGRVVVNGNLIVSPPKEGDSPPKWFNDIHNQILVQSGGGRSIP